MKIIPAFFLLAIVFLSAVSIVSAHGGVEKVAGDYIVVLNQTPLSPLIGEEVKMNFVITDKTMTKRISNLDVGFSLVDTFTGDESRDKIILKKEFKTDANGSFDFAYTFDKENYFDSDLSFKDDKGEVQSTGFLVQPRKEKQGLENLFIAATPAFLVGSVITLVLKNRIRRK